MLHDTVPPGDEVPAKWHSSRIHNTVAKLRSYEHERSYPLK